MGRENTVLAVNSIYIVFAFTQAHTKETPEFIHAAAAFALPIFSFFP